MNRKPVSITDIAALANTSVCTVSKVLSGKARASSISRQREAAVREIARLHDYRPSAAARSMRSRQTGHIGLLILNDPGRPLTTPSQYEVVLGIDAALSEQGYTSMLVRVSDVKSMESASRVFRERILEGMIVMDQQSPEVCAHVEAMLPRCIFAESGVWRPHNCIRRDEAWAGRMAAEKLLERGYRRLLWVGYTPTGAGDHFSLGGRYSGVQQAAARAGVALDAVCREEYQDPRVLREHLAAGTGVVPCSWDNAVGVVVTAAQAGLIPQRDFGLVSCEDSDAIVHEWPGLSRVAFDRYALGQSAASMLLTLLKGPERQVPSRLVKGDWVEGHTAPPRVED